MKDIKFKNDLKVGISPKNFDLAIVSISSNGTEGNLNLYVLNELDYDKTDYLPSPSQLLNGFYLLNGKGKVPVLFIVTVGNRITEELLFRNLFSAIAENYSILNGKNIWLPLLGTGVGELSLEKSYGITVNILNSLNLEFNQNTIFNICLPSTEEGIELAKKIFSKEEKGLINNLLESALSDYPITYYLAGSYWGGEEQLNRFIKDGIWETGFEEGQLESIINEVNQGDIIFSKSTFVSHGVSVLRIKAVGKVVNNPRNGFMINVDWQLICDPYIDINGLGFYRSAFSKVALNDVRTILSGIGFDKFLTLDFYSNLSNKANNIKSSSKSSENDFSSTYTDLISDTVFGEDYLDIKYDVTAFAKIITSNSFKPPLSIALFGKWGRGKSFFMDKLKSQILYYSQSNQPIYCRGVVQIHFNAWSYLDANLWASIVNKIFEGLSDYVNNDSRAKIYKNEIESHLSRQLTFSKQEVAILENQKEEIDNQFKTLENERNILNEALNQDINTIRDQTYLSIYKTSNSNFDIESELANSLQHNTSITKTKEQILQLVPEKYLKNPKAAYDNINSNVTFLREFFKPQYVTNNLKILLAIIILILIIPPILNSIGDYIKYSNFIVPQIFLSILISIKAIWDRYEVVYSKFQPIVASFWKIKEKYEADIEEAKLKFEQHEKAIRLKIERSKEQIKSIDLKIAKITSERAEIEFRLKNTISTEALQSFIEKRSKSDDYNKHLGIVSVIRKDFEILSNLFTEHNNELRNNTDFHEKFQRPIERIVLYIDDLDRCPEERVVEVLEAVNLLMAFELFVVVVGVDPRWVKNALLKKYHIQFGGGNHKSEPIDKHDFIDSSNYLEKIFQVPFHLKEASDNSVKNMLKTLCQPKENLKNFNFDNLDKSKITEEVYDNPDNLLQYFNSNSNAQEPMELDNNVKDDKIYTINSERLVLTDEEINRIQDFSEIIGNNPRTIKRFVNIYHIVRAHNDSLKLDLNNPGEFLIIMFLLALPNGPFKLISKVFKEFIDNSDNHLYKLEDFVGSNNQYENQNLNEKKNLLDVIMTDNNSFSNLRREPIHSFYTRNKFIQRFTFD